MANCDHTAVAVTGDPTMELTNLEKAFVQHIVHGLPQTHAARLAGYKTPEVDASRNMKKPRILEAIQHLHRKHEKASQMTRKKVMDGMLEAIQMAKEQADPNTMVSGWREIGRMCGYYAAEKKVVDINITAKRAVDRLEMLSDAELLDMIEELAGGERTTEKRRKHVHKHTHGSGHSHGGHAHGA